MRSKGRYTPMCAEHGDRSDPATWNAWRSIGVMAVDPEAGWFVDHRNCEICEATFNHDVPPEAVVFNNNRWSLRPGFRYTRDNVNYEFEE